MEKPTSSDGPRWRQAKAHGLQRTLVGLEMLSAASPAMDTKSSTSGKRDRLRHQRIAGALSKEKYRAGLRAADFAPLGTQVKVEIRGQGVGRASGAHSVLQAS